MRLHDYWRSGAAYRVRIALNLKGLPYDQVMHDLRTGEQSAQSYAALNPQKLVPTLEVDEVILTQSGAILEWLEEQYPNPSLLPSGSLPRAQARAMAAIVLCDIHPLNNLRVLSTLRQEFTGSEQRVLLWARRWINDGFAALEVLIGQHGGRYAFGDTPTLVDCCLVPQLYSAERFGVDVSAFPRVAAAGSAASALPAFIAAHPSRQSDGATA